MERNNIVHVQRSGLFAQQNRTIYNYTKVYKMRILCTFCFVVFFVVMIFFFFSVLGFVFIAICLLDFCLFEREKERT